jgi:beta-glucosidase
MAHDRDVVFPVGFLWGAATSSHQVEGGNDNDWKQWEDAGHAKGMRSGQATDHWRRFGEDFELAGEIGLNAYRFSIEWSRVEPAPGKFDAKAIQHYREMLRALKRRRLTPMVTLHHFTLPGWVAEQGGWANKQTAELFERYAARVAKELGREVQLWLTINEPSIVAGLGYLAATFPPGHRNLWEFFAVRRNQMTAHGLAYASIHQLYADEGWGAVQVSFANQQEWVAPRNPRNVMDCAVTWLQRAMTNRYFLVKSRCTTDFLAVNYYFPNRVYFRLGGRFGFVGQAQITGAEVSDVGWMVAPQGLERVCLDLADEGKPIYITENGLADEQDRWRAWAIVNACEALARAIKGGADVRGYFYWALTDTFEWEWGYGPRYGLIAVNFETLERRVRPSARVYGRIAKSNKLAKELRKRYA